MVFAELNILFFENYSVKKKSLKIQNVKERTSIFINSQKETKNQIFTKLKWLEMNLICFCILSIASNFSEQFSLFSSVPFVCFVALKYSKITNIYNFT